MCSQTQFFNAFASKTLSKFISRKQNSCHRVKTWRPFMHPPSWSPSTTSVHLLSVTAMKQPMCSAIIWTPKACISNGAVACSRETAQKAFAQHGIWQGVYENLQWDRQGVDCAALLGGCEIQIASMIGLGLWTMSHLRVSDANAAWTIWSATSMTDCILKHKSIDSNFP